MITAVELLVGLPVNEDAGESVRMLSREACFQYILDGIYDLINASF